MEKDLHEGAPEPPRIKWGFLAVGTFPVDIRLAAFKELFPGCDGLYIYTERYDDDMFVYTYTYIYLYIHPQKLT